MMWRARASLGGSTPMSTAAACRACTMAAAESISVPSQSNTIKSNCCAIIFLVVNIKPPQELAELRRQRRLERQGLARQRMSHFQLGRMQEHALQAQTLQLLVERKIAVFVVPE